MMEDTEIDKKMDKVRNISTCELTIKMKRGYC